MRGKGTKKMSKTYTHLVGKNYYSKPVDLYFAATHNQVFDYALDNNIRIEFITNCWKLPKFVKVTALED